MFWAGMGLVRGAVPRKEATEGQSLTHKATREAVGAQVGGPSPAQQALHSLSPAAPGDLALGHLPPASTPSAGSWSRGPGASVAPSSSGGCGYVVPEKLSPLPLTKGLNPHLAGAGAHVPQSSEVEAGLGSLSSPCSGDSRRNR